MLLCKCTYTIMFSCTLRCMKIDTKFWKLPATRANDRQFDPELRTVFPFSANSLDFSSLSFKVPKNQRGTLWWKKFEKKNSLFGWYLKKLRKCKLAMKSVFESIDFLVILVHNFPKNQYFLKPISLPICIFLSSSFDVSSIKIYFFNFFHQRFF